MKKMQEYEYKGVCRSGNCLKPVRLQEIISLRQRSFYDGTKKQFKGRRYLLFVCLLFCWVGKNQKAVHQCFGIIDNLSMECCMDEKRQRGQGRDLL